jgi:hypothetical protein
VAKIHYKPDLETIQNEEKDAKLFGEGAAHEWHQGLTTRGKDALADANRWAMWEQRLRAELHSAPGFNFVHVLRDRDSASFQQAAEQSRGPLDTTEPASSAISQGKSENHVQLFRECAHQVELRPEI